MSVHPGYFSGVHAIESTRDTVFVTVHDCILYMLQRSVIVMCMSNLLYLCVYIDFVNDKIVGHT